MPGPVEKTEVPAPNGVLLVDKPEDITSHGVVARARRAYGTRKVGHAGTLDPMATGLLVLGLGPSTRLLTYFVGLDKVYLATIRLGFATTTDDREGEAIGEAVDATRVPAERVAEGIAALTGPIEQVPSSVSAIKVDGRRSYARVRAGEDVSLPARPVTVHEFALLERRESADGAVDLDVRVACSSGTYIRALARDLGAALGTGGHLTALRRTAVGPFSVGDAVPLDGLGSDAPPADPAAIAERLFPVLRLDPAEAVDLGHGKRIAVTHEEASPVAAVGPDGRLLALVEVASGRARVLTAFPAAAQEVRS
ncbi:tRNA pseudouridine(55) synthase TruB [Naasia aerilata]|uniref:tRNA pseudouridine synthase B n=1 Tax=Naasia aerilata TaxID=1162966 RepID=A0ABN6XVN0_9MICO|nr:tRNA pseudouridine(55) synthase TruB [Naasia aerilata]BDZ47690.1 tRNA pseudouridine synthase B [Naasia aerilata]